MKKFSKKQAFELVTNRFGKWSMWNRTAHLCYGLMRGVEYQKMERCCNDNPGALLLGFNLKKLGAFDEPADCSDWHCKELDALVIWVKKSPRRRNHELTQAIATAPDGENHSSTAEFTPDVTGVAL